MDYQTELEEIKKYETTTWFKPEKGTYHVEILGEGEHVQKKFGDEEVTQWNLPIMINNAKFMWSITKGKSLASVYGQIVSLAVKNQNKAEGTKFTLIVKFDGKKNDYTIPEAHQ